MSFKKYTDLSDFAGSLITAKGYDYESIPPDQKQQKEDEILKIFFEFFAGAVLESKNQDLIHELQEYNESDFDFEYLENSKFLKQAFEETLTQFLKL